MSGSHTLINKNNSAWYGTVGYAGGNWGIKGGYRQVEPQYGAPGEKHVRRLTARQGPRGVGGRFTGFAGSRPSSTAMMFCAAMRAMRVSQPAPAIR